MTDRILTIVGFLCLLALTAVAEDPDVQPACRTDSECARLCSPADPWCDGGPESEPEMPQGGIAV